MFERNRIFKSICAAAVLMGLLMSASCQRTQGDAETSGLVGESTGEMTTLADYLPDTDAPVSAAETSGELTNEVEETTKIPIDETTKPEVQTQPEATTPPEVTTQPEATTTPEVTTQPEGTTRAEVTTAPEITTQAEVTQDMEKPDSPSVLNYADKKCMWLSQFDLNKVYSNGTTQRSKSQFTQYIKKILSNVKDNGINTIIVQVRPNADSMYPSEVYPMSVYVVGAYGNEAEYDPFGIIIDEAHALDLSVHAWINPMRAMLVSEVSKIPTKYRIRSWYDDPATRGKYLVTVSNRLYLNPAYPEVRQLITDGAAEILAKYEVDGLHMDDYFYPTTDASFDSAAYAEYKKDGGSATLANFRRDRLSELVSGLYSTVKAANPDILFGISPAGNINTVYGSQYADVYRWCSEAGYLDYICPQVYFGLEHQTYDFKKVSNTFQNIIKLNSVELIIGMTLGKAKSGTDQYAGTGKNEWTEHKDVLVRCLEYTKSLPKCRGVSYFCYQYFYDPTSGVSVKETQTERDNFVPLLKTISWTQ